MQVGYVFIYVVEKMWKRDIFFSDVKKHGGGNFFLKKNKKCNTLIRYLRVSSMAFHSIFVDCTAKSYVLTLYCKRLDTIATNEQFRFSVHSAVAKLFLGTFLQILTSI